MSRAGAGRIAVVGCVAALTWLLLSAGGGDRPSEPIGSTPPEVLSPGEELRPDFSWSFERRTISGTNCPVVGVEFRDRSTGQPTRWRWEFPSGVISEERDLNV